jgi:hypothetical protein
MKTSWPHWKQAPMNDTMRDLRQQDRNLDRALDPLDEAPLPDSLGLAYAARMRAVLHGAVKAQARTAREVEHLERLCLQRRQLHRLADVANIDSSYYLG